MFDSILTWFVQHGLTEGMVHRLIEESWKTIIMAGVSCFFGFLLGLPAGILLYVTKPGQILENKVLYKVLSTVVNVLRSVPFIIMIFWVAPLTNLVIGTSYGVSAVLVPLSVAAAPFIARMVENSLLELPYGLIEAAKSMGATPLQIILKVMLPEALPSLVNSFTITLITLIGYSAMGGAVGAGGLGFVAYQYGYIGNNPVITNAVLVLLLLLVYIVQFTGERIVKAVTHK